MLNKYFLCTSTAEDIVFVNVRKKYGSLLDVKVHMMVFYTEVPSSCPQKLWSMLALSKSVPYFFMNSQVDECNFFLYNLFS